jgi:hypothetical protein
MFGIFKGDIQFLLCNLRRLKELLNAILVTYIIINDNEIEEYKYLGRKFYKPD